jgi:hypothetical protein
MEKVSGPNGSTLFVRTLLVVGQRDVWLGLSLLSAEGETPQHAFQFASDLSSATLSTTVTVFDVVSQQFYDFEVNLTWTAQGAPVSHHCKETFHDKELGIKTQLRGTHVDAEATGTIVGLGQNFTPEPSVSAELQTQNSGTVIVEKTR